MNDRRVKFRGKNWNGRLHYQGPSRERHSDRNRGPSTSTSLDDPNILNHDRPPPGLRGKALGLWYRDKNRAKQGVERQERNNRKHTIPLELRGNEIKIIKDVLGSFDFRQVRRNRSSEDQGSTEGLHEKYMHVEESDFKNRFLKSISGSLEEKIKQGLHICSLRKRPGLDDKYKQELQAKHENNSQFKAMLAFRKKLPAFDKKDDILEALNKTNAILISGETGCGKTTQVAQFLLEKEIRAGRGSTCHIICTQPRRISAISVAERVAQERGEPLGHSVGYQIRLEKVPPNEVCSILYCTTGVLLQFMHSDPLLTCASHIIIDEVHERDTISDFVITLLRDILPVRPDLKVVLMSATLNAEKFSKYFFNCPTVHIPGFTFPVKEFYLEDVIKMTRFRFQRRLNKKEEMLRRKEREQFIDPYVRNLQRNGEYPPYVLNQLALPESEDISLELMMELLEHICRTAKDNGAILVFLPGWDRISKLNRLMTENGNFPPHKYLIIPLHSMMPTISQKSVFDRPPPGKRKIVIATNIAETSITIDDIVYVVDCGKIKIKTFDVESNLSTLKEEWVSLANAKQRKGRAGRVQAGVCYHLFTRGREMMLDSYQLPEMLRTRLEEVILQAKILQLGKIAPFLEKVLDPPVPRAVELSLKLLREMNALDDAEHLTPLGYHLANLPIDPQPGKMILLAAMFCCLDTVTSVAASLSFKDPFVIPLGKERDVDRRRKELDNGLKSDHLLIAEVVSQWERAASNGRGREYAHHNYLASHTVELLRDMKQQFARHLHDMKYISSPDVKNREANINANRPGLVKAVVCAGLYPNVAIIKKAKRSIKTGLGSLSLFTPEDGRVQLHPKSVNNQEFNFTSKFLVYYEKMKSSGIFLHDTTMVSPWALIFFCHSFQVETAEDNKDIKIIIVNDVIRFSCSTHVANLVQDLRDGLDWLLEYKISHPGLSDLSNSHSDSIESRLLRAIIELVTIEDEMFDEDGEDDLDNGFEY